ncbi:MAG: NADH-quinone oxidoreductase subunit NuoN [Alphaproteobacteria bacterium]|nr:NADH-quinone oxidoreductase subunit NuoN [Alphaproteobacteria bacterium]
MTELPDFHPALPEIALALSGLLLLMYGAVRKDAPSRFVGYITVFVLLAVQVLEMTVAPGEGVTFSGLFISDRFAVFMKSLVLLGSALAVLLSFDYHDHEKQERIEYPILILFATLGMMMMISANSLLSLYLGLELQSLCLYVLAAIRRDTLRSTEAGLKYFILGALSSGLLLYGMSLIYGFAGSTEFPVLAEILTASNSHVPVGVIVGLVFMMAGLAFKISAVPFHMWTPDVYEGAPTPVTAFFAVAPKIAAIALFIRVLVDPLGGLVEEWRQVVVAVSLASMILGSFAALAQTNIKRLMAYSSIGHVGYALVGLAAGTPAGVQGVLIYMTVYLFMVVGTFAVILCMRQHDRMVEEIEDLAGLSKTHPMIALAMAVFMFSMAGIPPLAGFFGKLYVFLAAIESGLYTLAIIGILTSVVGAFYYMRIIKFMYFDESHEPLDKWIGRDIAVILAVTGVFTMFFFVYPEPILSAASVAAASLFPGG